MPATVASQAPSDWRNQSCRFAETLSTLMPAAAKPASFNSATLAGVSRMPFVPSTGRSFFDRA